MFIALNRLLFVSLLLGLFLSFQSIRAQWVLQPQDSALLAAKTNVRYGNTFYNTPEVLKLSLSEVGKLPPDIDRLKNLRLLEIYAPERMPTFLSVPEPLWQLTNIEYLLISHTSIDSLSPLIHNLTALRELHLPHNPKLKKLPPEVSQLPMLEVLDAGTAALPHNLSYASRLRVLHTTAARLPSLPQLQILYCNGEKLTDQVLSMGNLRQIHLGDAVQPVNAALKLAMNLPTLESLSFNAVNADRYAWEHLSRMHTLQSLTIRKPRYLTDEIKSLNQLSELTLLDYTCYAPGSCTDIFGPLAALPRLEKLTINRIADHIDTLQHLRVLRLIDCPDLRTASFRRLSEQLRRLPNLEELDLQGTDLTQTKFVALDSLGTLKVLNLAYTRMPYSEGAWLALLKMKSLKKLVVSTDDRGVGKCAEELLKMKQLTELVIHNRERQGSDLLAPDCIVRLKKALPNCKIVIWE